MAPATDEDEHNIKFCKDCIYSSKNYQHLWMLLIPLIGQFIFICMWFDGTLFKPYCKYGSTKDLVTGKLSRKSFCNQERWSGGSCKPEGLNFVPKRKPLRKVDSKIIMEEVLQRGLLEVIKDYKRVA